LIDKRRRLLWIDLKKVTKHMLNFLTSISMISFSSQEQAIQEAEASSEHELLRTIFSVEVTRVKYMLRSYLRTRLFKVEQFVMHCLDSPEVRERLSPLEDTYATQYLRLVVGHLANTVSSKLPEAFSSVFKQASAHAANDMIPAPDLGRHVFVKILRDLGQVEVYEDGGMHELNKGDLYIMKYNMLRPMLADGAVQLL
jgi:GINS complex subunit 4